MRRQAAGSVDDDIEVISLTASDGGDVVPPPPAGLPVAVGAAGWRVSACTEGRLCATEVCLRFVACGLALVAAVVLAVDRETHDFMGLFVKVARYTDIPAFV